MYLRPFILAPQIWSIRLCSYTFFYRVHNLISNFKYFSWDSWHDFIRILVNFPKLCGYAAWGKTTALNAAHLSLDSLCQFKGNREGKMRIYNQDEKRYVIHAISCEALAVWSFKASGPEAAEDDSTTSRNKSSAAALSRSLFILPSPHLWRKVKNYEAHDLWDFKTAPIPGPCWI